MIIDDGPRRVMQKDLLIEIPPFNERGVFNVQARDPSELYKLANNNALAMTAAWIRGVLKESSSAAEAAAVLNENIGTRAKFVQKLGEFLDRKYSQRYPDARPARSSSYMIDGEFRHTWGFPKSETVPGNQLMNFAAGKWSPPPPPQPPAPPPKPIEPPKPVEPRRDAPTANVGKVPELPVRKVTVAEAEKIAPAPIQAEVVPKPAPVRVQPNAPEPNQPVPPPKPCSKMQLSWIDWVTQKLLLGD
jgi:hypothetical protein